MSYTEDFINLKGDLETWYDLAQKAYNSDSQEEQNSALDSLRLEHSKIEASLSSKEHKLRSHLIESSIAETETLIGRLQGNLSLIDQGIKRTESFIDFIRTGIDKNSKYRQRALCRAQAYYGLQLSRRGYISASPEDLERSVHQLRIANELRHEYLPGLSEELSRSKKSFNTLIESALPLRAKIHLCLGDAYVAQLIWDPKSTVDGSGITFLSEASEDFETLRAIHNIAAKKVIQRKNKLGDGADYQGPPSANRTQISPYEALDFWNSEVTTELYAARSSLAVALAVTAERIRKIDAGSPEGKTFYSENRDPNDLYQQSISVADRCYKGIKDQIKRSGERETPHRWDRTFSNLAFAYSKIYESNPRRTNAAKRAQELFGWALARYTAERAPFRRAVNLQGMASLLESTMENANTSLAKDAATQIILHLKEASTLFKNCGSKERFDLCQTSLAQHQEERSAQDDFRTASIGQILERFEPKVSPGAMERLQQILIERQNSPPTDPRAFADNFNRALDALGLVIRIVGLPGYARLGVGRGNLRLQMNDSGARGLKKADVFLERLGPAISGPKAAATEHPAAPQRGPADTIQPS